jgi:hypothetical protein
MTPEQSASNIDECIKLLDTARMIANEPEVVRLIDQAYDYAVYAQQDYNKRRDQILMLVGR